MALNIGYFLTKRAILSPKKEALVCEDIRMTWPEINARANRLAHVMRKLGVGHGDRVGMLAFNEIEYYEMLFGLGKIGAILVPLNYRLAGPELEYIISDCTAHVLVFGKEYTEVVDSIRKDIPVKHFITLNDAPPNWASSYEKLSQAESEEEPEIIGGDDDVLTILYTSGTTGRPKGAMLTHNNYFWTSVTLISTLGWAGDTMLVALPLFHVGALGPVPMYVHLGLRVVLLRSLDPQRFLELIQEEKVTCFGSVPALLNILKLVPDFDKYDWNSVDTILVYAAPVPVTLIKEYAASGIEIRQLYGLTECTGPASVIDPENAIVKAGSCGLPFFHNDIRLVDDHGEDVAPGKLGEVIIRGEGVMKGYWNLPNETAKTIKDNWLYTGDLAKEDNDGYLYILDRKKDMIISGGENIYPAEIEDFLISHPKVSDVGVIGFSHNKWGEAVKAIVVTKKGEKLTETELIEWCEGKIGKFKIPKSVVFADSIPRTPTGKILKRELRGQYNIV
jgi:acyl-CoA synthetase (AMP-forming)/AMP-acid ligase II